MDNVSDESAIALALDQKKADHEVMTGIGQIIRQKFPKPLEQLSAFSKDFIVRALVATCDTKEEITEVLSAAGLTLVQCSIVSGLQHDLQEGVDSAFETMGGMMTKNGTPCFVLVC